MKLLFTVCFFAAFTISVYGQAAHKPAKPVAAHAAAAASATLAVKANTAATLLLDDKKIGSVNPNEMAQFSIGPGSHFLSLVPDDQQQFRRIDTTISVANGSHLALLLRADAVVLGPKELIQKVLKATGLSGFGKKFHSIRYTVAEPFQLRKCAYVYPETGRIHEDLLDEKGNVRSFNNGRLPGNDLMLVDELSFTRYGFTMSTNPDTNEPEILIQNRESGTTGIDTSWSRSDDPEKTWNWLTRDLFQYGGKIFQEVENAQWSDVQEEMINDKPVRKVQLSSRRDVDDYWGVTEVLMYVDKATSLPLKCVYNVRSSMGDYRFEYAYADYRLFGPCMLPTKVTAALVSVGRKNKYLYVPSCRNGNYILSDVAIDPSMTDADKLFYRPQVSLMKN